MLRYLLESLRSHAKNAILKWLHDQNSQKKKIKPILHLYFHCTKGKEKKDNNH